MKASEFSKTKTNAPQTKPCVAHIAQRIHHQMLRHDCDDRQKQSSIKYLKQSSFSLQPLSQKN